MDHETPLICECVTDDAFPVLVDVLGIFSDTDGGGNPYLSLDIAGIVCARHGRGPVALILNLLEHLGYVGHYGNLMCSSFLTERGAGMRREMYAMQDNDNEM